MGGRQGRPCNQLVAARFRLWQPASMTTAIANRVCRRSAVYTAASAIRQMIDDGRAGGSLAILPRLRGPAPRLEFSPAVLAQHARLGRG